MRILDRLAGVLTVAAVVSFPLPVCPCSAPSEQARHDCCRPTAAVKAATPGCCTTTSTAAPAAPARAKVKSPVFPGHLLIETPHADFGVLIVPAAPPWAVLRV
jgi:hypothetical protein